MANNQDNLTADVEADPTIVAAGRSLADRARKDGISLTMLVQAATLRRRPEFAAALDYAIEAGLIDGWQGVEKDGGPGDFYTPHDTHDADVEPVARDVA